MCYRTKENFDKYWSEYSVVLSFGTILDPTKALYKLFEEYSNKGGSTFMASCFSNVSKPPRIIRRERENVTPLSPPRQMKGVKLY